MLKNFDKNKIYMWIYRHTALLVIGSMFPTIVIFFLMMGFFFFNESWVAPTQLSLTSDKMLTFSQGYMQASQNVATLQGGVMSAKHDYDLAVANASKYKSASNTLASTNRTLSDSLNGKMADINDTRVLSNELNMRKSSIRNALKAGLITNSDAASQLSGIQTFHNLVNDGKTTSIATRSSAELSMTQLNIQAMAAQSDVTKARDILKLAQAQLAPANTQLKTLKSTVYYSIMTQGNANMAFVPYENLDNLSVGQPVFDCYLTIVLCYKVGTISSIQHDETTVPFPVMNIRFSRDMRGYFVLLNIDKGEEASMRSKLLFFGRKPLFF